MYMYINIYVVQKACRPKCYYAVSLLFYDYMSIA